MKNWLPALAERLDWPVLTLELHRCARSDRGLFFSPVVAVALSALFIVAGLNASHEHRSFEIGAQMALAASWVLRIAIGWVAVPSFCARGIASEREAGRFDALAMTSLNSSQIVMQKIALPQILAICVAVFCLPIDFFAPAILGWNRLNMLAWPVVFVAGSFLNATIGILASCLCRGTQAAEALGLAMMLVVNAAAFFAVVGAFGGCDAWLAITLCGTGYVILTVELLDLAATRVESLRRSAS